MSLLGRTLAAGPLLVALLGLLVAPVLSATGDEPSLAAAQEAAPAATTDEGVIRLRPSGDAAGREAAGTTSEPQTRRGFDYQRFESRLQSLWFQRKAFLASGRDDDAGRQAQDILDYCLEEGVRRLDHLAGALVSEARRAIEEGSYDKASTALDLAESFDPGRPQVHVARAALQWQSGRGRLAAAGSLFAAARTSFLRSLADLSLFDRLALVIVVAASGAIFAFSLLMLARHQVAFRHEVAEWLGAERSHLAGAAGLGLLLLPLVVWVGAGWSALYWLVITFRFMNVRERTTSALLLLACTASLPAYRVSVSLYGMTADPLVRTTLASAGGEYDPDHILKLQRLVDAYPEDPVYRFLLGGLYKNGRYFEDAYHEYKEAVRLDPMLVPAQINVGNIFLATGQHAEAINAYRQVLELDGSSVLAYFNLHLAQSESFRFKEADESLGRARQIDSREVASLLSRAGQRGDRPAAPDAVLDTSSIWAAAVEGRTPREALSPQLDAESSASWLTLFLGPVSLMSLLALVACGVSLMRRGPAPARRCIRCGKAFCQRCKSGREGPEYCSQCLHLYVLGDGLAPQARKHKMYEVDRHERLARLFRRLVSIVLPGSGQVLRGRAGWGALLILAWIGALVAWKPAALRPMEKLAGLDLRLELLEPGGVPAMFQVQPLAIAGFGLLLAVWITGNAWIWRGGRA